MNRIPLCLVLVCLSFAAAAPAAAVDPVVHAIEVTGAGSAMYPAFAPDIERYAITTTGATAGTVVVRATTSDPTGLVRINGRAAPDGSRTLTGLRPGDEISVLLTDGLGTAVHSLVYLPPGFPELRRAAVAGGVDAPSPGLVMLTLGFFPSTHFEAVVDANGVPVAVAATAGSLDLKRQPNGNYSVARTTGPASGSDIVELDSQFREVNRHRTVGLTHTDGHDSILLPDGTRYLLAYEPNDDTQMVDAIIQHIESDDTVLFQWNSKDHVDIDAETVVPSTNEDYAHVNSIEIMADGDLLVSFRHFSSVFKIARTAHDGYVEGQVIWKLGGRASSFELFDTAGRPDGGPCAQHTATELENGNILVFDNGGWPLETLCIDPSGPNGELGSRLPTRIAEWTLDAETGEASMVNAFQVDDRYALFAGSAQRLANGNTMVGWGSMRGAVASELDPTGVPVWELAVVGAPQDFTYRAVKTDVPDAIAPTVSVISPVDGATYVQGERIQASYDCTDRGGSSLRACGSTPIDTSLPGTRTVTVTGTDGAGNSASVTRTYTVVAPAAPTNPAPTPIPPPTSSPVFQPDALIRGSTSPRFRGDDVYGAAAVQRVSSALRGPEDSATVVVRIQNDGTVPDRFAIRKVSSSKMFGVSYRFPGKHARTPLIQPGGSWTFRIEVSLRSRAQRGDHRAVKIVVSSLSRIAERDVVWFRVRAR